jgi:hypothetical protein
MRAALLFGLMLATAPEQTGSLQGMVVCEGTAEPVSGVQVTIGGEVRAVTDNAGRFAIDNAPAGNTSVRARREGFYGPAVNGEFPASTTTSVVVLASRPTNVKITLVPGGSVSGKVFDSKGRPMHDSVVGILRIVYRQGERAVDVVAAQPSGNGGEYRLYPVPPGEYYVGVAPPAGSQVTTLYPNTTALSLASKILVKAAEEVQGIDIHAQMGK